MAIALFPGSDKSSDLRYLCMLRDKAIETFKDDNLHPFKVMGAILKCCPLLIKTTKQ